MDFLSYPYGLRPWHASKGNWTLKLKIVLRYVTEHLGRGICFFQGLCRHRTQKNSVISTLILTKTSIFLLPTCAFFSSVILRRLLSTEYTFFCALFWNTLRLCPSLDIFKKLGDTIMALGTT
jgi:hypothetical protein